MVTQLSRIKKISLAVRAAYNLLRLAMKPQNTDYALAVSDRFLELGLFESGVKHLKSNPLTAPLVEQPLSISKFDLEQLIKLPQGSLGYELATVMKAGNLDPNYFRRKNPPVLGKVILDHIEQTHDIWHIVLDFDISEAGEIGILSFQFGQLRSPQAVAFISGAIMRCLFKDLSLLPPIMDAIVRGWLLSKKWPPLFAVPWDKIMHLHVEHIRRQLDQGIIPS